MNEIAKKKKKKKIIKIGFIILLVLIGGYFLFKPKDLTHKLGMTWGVISTQSISVGSVTHVSCNGRPALDKSPQCDEKKGDTPCSKTLPILCLKKNSPPPPDLQDLSSTDTHAKWGGGDIALSKPTLGTDLRSRLHADDLCTTEFGPSWKMAEFHDGSEFGFRGKGSLVEDSRFWVANKDEAANCW